MNASKKPRNFRRVNRWLLLSKSCLHGIKRSEYLLIQSKPNRSFVRNSVSVFTVSRAFGLLAGIGLIVLIVLLFAGCQLPRPQKGGTAISTISRPGHTNAASLTQSENPQKPSKQSVQSEQTIEYVLPPGTLIPLSSAAATAQGYPNSEAISVRVPSASESREVTSTGSSPITNVPAFHDYALLDRPVPVRVVVRDRTETTLGAAQKDTVREFAAKAASIRPVMWAGIMMMTLVAGAFVYFGWWTKAALALSVGIGMIVLAQTLPQYGGIILFGGLGVFALLAFLVLYAYYKGRLDQNHNGIPDFLERDREVAGPTSARTDPTPLVHVPTPDRGSCVKDPAN